jgi:hypothetical protein
VKLHWDVAPKNGRALIARIASHPEIKPFVLAGGTALALQEGHRSSADFDFFAFSPDLALPPLGRFRHAELRPPRGRVRLEARGTLHAELSGVQLTFLATDSPWLRRPRRFGRLRLAHPVDIGLMKLGAIIQRGTRRDFIDLACVLGRHTSLDRLLRLAPRKFPDVRDVVPQALQALVYFADAEHDLDPPRLDPDYRWDRVKKQIEAEARNVARKRIGRPR